MPEPTSRGLTAAFDLATKFSPNQPSEAEFARIWKALRTVGIASAAHPAS
jgi:hypothetical protein